MGRIFDRSVLIGIGLVTALLIESALVAYWNTVQLNEDAGWVAHTHAVLDLNSDVMLALVDAETGERGFLLTGREEFLQPYKDALPRLQNRMGTLKEKLKDNSKQQERIQKLEQLAAERLALLKERIDLRRTRERDPGALDAARKGKQQMDAIRSLVAEMEREEHLLLKERELQSRRAFQVAIVTGILTAVFGLLMVGAFVGVLRRSLVSRQRAAAVVQEQRELFRTTLASIGDAVIATDVEGKVTFLNSVAETLTGWRENEAKGQPLQTVFQIISEESRQTIENPADKALQQGTVVGLANHTVLIAKDGTERPIDDSAAPIRNEHGVVAGVVLVFRDVAERRRAEKAQHEAAIQTEQAYFQVRQAEESLKEADRRKDEFLALLGHELRNPLAPIRNALHVLKLPGADAAVIERSRAMMERQLQQLVHLVDDLLDVSRIMRGRVELRKLPIDLATVVARAVETVQPTIDGEAHQLAVSLPPSPLWVNGDLVRLTQVVSNLLHNAAKYTERGGRIELTAERNADEAVLRVRDTGIGIAPDQLGRVFDMFYQAERRTSNAQGGLGLGLSLVRGLVELHGGKVEAHSAGPGTGAEFIVRLSLLERDDKKIESGKLDDPSTAGQPSPRRILVVDDNVDAAESLAMLLRLQGHNVHVAYNGASALKQAAADAPQIAFMDIGMPKMDGFELARRFREDPRLRQVRLVALTGWGQEEDRRRTKEAGFDFHLVKPVEPEALRPLLDESKKETNNP